MPLAIALHMLAATIWVGGMFFAYMALRPVAASLLEPPQRLPLWRDVFARFFPWVWVSVLLSLASGYWMAFKLFGGFATLPLYVNIMQGLGILMILIYMHVFFGPYRRMKQAIAAGDLPTAGARLAQIRLLIGVNLSLGLIVTAIASGGRYF
ncbi:CopD family protein [Sulfuriflexus mobilis]|uniref:CopD family protein n=1 Tax=Sulfuriflexus mobilis TaxID=1811807 RepID=UPI000F81AAFB|nr:CopD family protein [Sulfuriflexus mobilis]